MNLIEKFDNAFLSFFTKISHRFQRLTGRTNFFLAKIMIILTMISFMTRIGNYWVIVLHRPTTFLVTALAALATLFVFIDMNLCDKAEEIAFSSKNRAKVDFGILGSSPFIRMFWIFISLGHLLTEIPSAFLVSKGILIFKIFYFFFPSALAAYLYFIHVDPLPPCKSKIKEWIESFSAGFKKSAQIS